MKFSPILITLALSFSLMAQVQHPQGGPIYAESEVAKLEVFIDTDSLAFILDPANTGSEHEFRVTVVFSNSSFSDTINNVGFRLRGNTSRQADKKSFKISFNSFTSGRRYQGFKDFNFNGEHNDPSISRARICWNFAAAEGIPTSRIAHAQLYVNGVYKGLYINTEHINNDWLSLRFGSNTGNLYKCTYPANLRFISNNPNDYKLTKNNGERVYELKTNEDVDDYGGLAQFIAILNNTPQSQLVCALDSIFNVEAYLKTLAFEVIMGHWDNYSFNQNNYYLYENPLSGKIEYIPYDVDNSLGVDWFGIDWANRDVNNWQNPAENMPLADRLLAIPELKEIYQFYLRDFALKAGSTSLSNHIDSIKNQISSYAYADTFKSLDYGFSNSDFDQSFTTTQPNQHVKKGIKSYLSTRSVSALNQLGTFNAAPIILYAQADINTLPGQVLFKAIVNDEGLPTVICNYSLVAASQQNLSLYDDGLHNDGAANDGLYANTITAPSTGSVSFQITAIDAQSKSRNSPCNFQSISINPMGAVIINEFMADNDNTIIDNNGNYNDWIEIYNNGSDTLFLGDYYLSDNASTPLEWALPAENLAPGSFRIYWASSDTAAGVYHTNFGLSKGGEEIVLSKIENGVTVQSDFISFGAQTSDISYGRSYDAAPLWQSFSVPTPNASNGTLSIKNVNLNPDFSLYPNPFKDHFILQNNAHDPLEFQVFDAFGRCLQEGTISKQTSLEVKDNAAAGLRILIISRNSTIIHQEIIQKR